MAIGRNDKRNTYRDMRACSVRIKLRLNDRRIIIELMVLKVEACTSANHTRASPFVEKLFNSF